MSGIKGMKNRVLHEWKGFALIDARIEHIRNQPPTQTPFLCLVTELFIKLLLTNEKPIEYTQVVDYLLGVMGNLTSQ